MVHSALHGHGLQFLVHLPNDIVHAFQLESLLSNTSSLFQELSIRIDLLVQHLLLSHPKFLLLP